MSAGERGSGRREYSAKAVQDFGLGMGYVACRLLKRVDNCQVGVLSTLALVTGGYALAMALHLSILVQVTIGKVVKQAMQQTGDTVRSDL